MEPSNGDGMTYGAKTAFGVKAPLLVPKSIRTWRHLTAIDGWSPERLAALNARRSADIARFAFEKSPFYHGYYRDHGFTAADLDDPDVFDSLPLVSKQLIREHNHEVATTEATDRTSARSVTSGSTGEPLSLLRDLRVPARAYEWRLLSWWGVEPWSDVATIDRYYRTPKQQLQQQVLWWPARRIQMDTFNIDRKAVRTFAEAWSRLRPQFLTGYVGGVVALVRFLAEEGLELSAPTAIGVTAGPLVPAQRREIEEGLGAPVYDHYRTSEANWLAGECGMQEGLHTFDDIKRIEILRDGADAGTDTGEVVVTDFTNRVFPIVRYSTGDVSRHIHGPCRCGRPHSRIEPIQGRTIDYLVFPSGKVIVGGLTGTFAGMEDHVRQFQIYQRADHGVEVRVILTDAPDARARAEERVDRLRRNIGGEAEVTLHEVAEIDGSRGKFRYVISDAARRAEDSDSVA